MQTININNLYKKVSDTFNLKVDQLDLEVGKNLWISWSEWCR